MILKEEKKYRPLVWRQGDIPVIQVAGLPPDAKEIEHDGVLAYGEATGHSHRIANGQVRFFRSERGNFFEVMSGFATLTHEGHFDHRLPKGLYEWKRQREADWANEMTRQVVD